MPKTNKTILVIIVIIMIIIFFKTSNLFVIYQPKEMECFDYIDNDNDGLYDLDDTDCFGLGMEDTDNDGFSDIEEYEMGTDIYDAKSFPKE